MKILTAGCPFPRGFGNLIRRKCKNLTGKIGLKSWKMCPNTLKSNILDYWIILTLEKCRIRLLWKSSSEKHPNYVAKLPQSNRKSHVKNHILLSRSAGSNKKKDTLCRSNSHLYYSELQDSGSFNMSGCGHNQ